jgi:hypothetical protein
VADSRPRLEQNPSPGPALLLCQGWFAAEGGVDGAGELAFEAAERFAAAFAFALFAFGVGAGGWVAHALNASDRLQRHDLLGRLTREIRGRLTLRSPTTAGSRPCRSGPALPQSTNALDGQFNARMT